MADAKNYNKLNALVYETIVFLCRFYPLKSKPWIRRILDYCLPDWSAFRAEVAMLEVEEQIKNIQKEWEKEEREKQEPIYTEEPADDSEAQRLLGGEMRLRAPFSDS